MRVTPDDMWRSPAFWVMVTLTRVVALVAGVIIGGGCLILFLRGADLGAHYELGFPVPPWVFLIPAVPAVILAGFMAKALITKQDRRPMHDAMQGYTSAPVREGEEPLSFEPLGADEAQPDTWQDAPRQDTLQAARQDTRRGARKAAEPTKGGRLLRKLARFLGALVLSVVVLLAGGYLILLRQWEWGWPVLIGVIALIMIVLGGMPTTRRQRTPQEEREREERRRRR